MGSRFSPLAPPVSTSHRMPDLFAPAEVAPEDKPHYLGHRQRLREKLLKAVAARAEESLPDYEVLEALLFASSPRSDVKPLAKALLQQFGSLGKILASPAEVLSKHGLASAGIAMLKATAIAAQRMIREDIAEKPILASWKSLLDYCRATMQHLPTEQFRIFFLDTKAQLIADELQQEGTVNHTPVYPREVVKRALELGASSIILVHNHPSGDVTPSKADRDMTMRVQQAAAGVDITVHDHLIIGTKGHFSFASKGLL